VYAGSDDHRVYALDARDGRKIWESATGNRVGSGIAVAGGAVYAGSFDHKVYGCAPATAPASGSSPPASR
jgi:outer membrane protein assembly factor BamB